MRSNDFAAGSYPQNSSASHASSAISALLIIDRRLRNSSLPGRVSLGTEATCWHRNPDAVERQSPHAAAVGQERALVNGSFQEARRWDRIPTCQGNSSSGARSLTSSRVESAPTPFRSVTACQSIPYASPYAAARTRTAEAGTRS